VRRKYPRRGYAKASKPRRIPGLMNATEKEYAGMLDARISRGEVACYWYERMTLKLGADLRYTPDFLVLMADGSLEVHETKGPLVRDDALAKLKMAADAYPFRFWMIQKQAKKLGGKWEFREIVSESWAEAA
jgi:hypothetical protein